MSLSGWKTAIGMILVLLGQVCHILAAKWPLLMGVGTILIDIGSGFGVVGLTHKAIKLSRTPE
jgi:hypothetical protein